MNVMERKTDRRQLGSAMTPNEEGPFVVQPDGSSMNPAYFGNSSKSIRRASDILFRGFLPGFRPPNILGDPMASFKRNLVATPLIYNNEANGIAGNSRLHEDNL
ncbi:hypothetical protein HELRODRAFT_163595 [Helobdella robusta]|uniref:Uncharacterized protein n=1 Tax=Helobdella robusta TaxID=6412 RepID=T1EU96_HELRO|nr:hypothetical protein HELRODRAFT_163595 [Helobdella robusta]ESN96525.1 hypothetical protein HELRODRAFT_163595 [Helobdella robusta]